MNGGLISTASAYGMCLPGMRFTDIYLPHVPITQEQPISGFVSENTSNVVRNKRSKNTVWEIANPLASTTESPVTVSWGWVTESPSGRFFQKNKPTLQENCVPLFPSSQVELVSWGWQQQQQSVVSKLKRGFVSELTQVLSVIESAEEDTTPSWGTRLKVFVNSRNQDEFTMLPRG
jgi:hypothetical protein